MLGYQDILHFVFGVIVVLESHYVYAVIGLMACQDSRLQAKDCDSSVLVSENFTLSLKVRFVLFRLHNSFHAKSLQVNVLKRKRRVWLFWCQEILHSEGAWFISENVISCKHSYLCALASVLRCFLSE